MAIFKFDNAKGLFEQPGGNGFNIDGQATINGRGIAGSVHTHTTAAFTRTGGGTCTALELTLPKGAMLTDVGFVVTTAVTMGGSGDMTVAVGTGQTAATSGSICEKAKLIDNAAGADNHSCVAVNGASSEGAAALSFVAEAAMWSEASRTITVAISGSGQNTTAGQGAAFAKYVII